MCKEIVIADSMKVLLLTVSTKLLQSFKKEIFVFFVKVAVQNLLKILNVFFFSIFCYCRKFMLSCSVHDTTDEVSTQDLQTVFFSGAFSFDSSIKILSRLE